MLAHGQRQSTCLEEGATRVTCICAAVLCDASCCSAVHRAAAAGGGRNRFDSHNLKERDSNEIPEFKQVKPTGGVIEMLMRDDGALVDAFDHAGFTALHVAAAAADADAAKALCAAGARYDAQAANDGDDSEKGELKSCNGCWPTSTHLHVFDGLIAGSPPQQQPFGDGAEEFVAADASKRGDAGLALKKLR